MKMILIPTVILSLLLGGFIGYRLAENSVGLSSYSFSDFDPDNYANATGSWISDSPDGYFHDNPFQTSEISCYKSRGFCIEARALKNPSTNNILAMNLEYEIKTWQPDKVVASLDGSAATIEITFDRKKKIVTLVETEKPEAAGASRLPVYAHLDDGEKQAK